MDKKKFFDSENVEKAGSKAFIALLWEEFKTQFPTENDCLTELYRIAGIEVQCSFCRGQSLELTEKRRTGSCADCRKETWFTANTILAHMKKPIARLAAIWLLSKGAILNSIRFAELVDICQSSAYDTLKWARIIIEANLPGNVDLVDSSFFLALFGKRSFFTPAKQHPSSEQAEIERIEADKESKSNESTGTKEPLSLEEEKILQIIEENNQIRAEAIIQRASMPVGAVNANLVFLEIKELIKRLPGDQYIPIKKQQLPAPLKEELVDAISYFQTFIRTSYGAISRRYLQSYLAAFWCFQASYQSSQREILQICFSQNQNIGLNLYTYLTPRLVKLTLPA